MRGRVSLRVSTTERLVVAVLEVSHHPLVLVSVVGAQERVEVELIDPFANRGSEGDELGAEGMGSEVGVQSGLEEAHEFAGRDGRASWVGRSSLDLVLVLGVHEESGDVIGHLLSEDSSDVGEVEVLSVVDEAEEVLVVGELVQDGQDVRAERSVDRVDVGSGAERTVDGGESDELGVVHGG